MSHPTGSTMATKPRMPQWPYGKIIVRTNSAQIVQLPRQDYYQYTVVIVSATAGGKEPKHEMNNKLFHHLQNVVAPEHFKTKMVYDRKNIAYCARRLDFGSGSSGRFFVHLKMRGPATQGTKGAYMITIDLANASPINAWRTRDLTHEKIATPEGILATNLLQLIVRQRSNQSHFINNSKSYFNFKEDNDSRDTRRGYAIILGFSSNVKPAPGCMLLTIDTATGVVYSEIGVIDFCLKTLSKRNARDLQLARHTPDFRKLEHILVGVRVVIDYGGGIPPKRKTIRALEPSAGRFSFARDDKTELSVAEYFKSTYNRQLEFPDIIGINLVGNVSDKKIIVPLEVCSIDSGQQCKKIPDDIKSEMVRLPLGPNEKYNKIERELNAIQRNQFLLDAGLVIENNLLPINAKVFTPPELTIAPSATISQARGKWNVKDKRLAEPGVLKSWAVLNLCPGDLKRHMVDGYMHAFRACCTGLGMVMPDNLPRYLEAQPYNLLPVLNQLPVADSPHAHVLFIFLPNEASSARTQIKYWGDCRRGTITQCLRLNKVKNNQYWNNVALKVNARLGGRNFWTKDGIIDWMRKEGPYMIMGADVGHPSPGVRKPSVTSLVYSLDPQATRYAALTGIQSPRQEIIGDIKDFVKKAIIHFKDENKITPAAIFFFRDGVSDGEYDAVRREEIPKIEEAIREIKNMANMPNHRIMLTFMVVTKRHHTVFFGRDRNQVINCDPGLVVDSQITNPTEKDFYLQSHQAIQGTARSSHYVVLRDDCFQYNSSALQRLSFDLCHVYAKATRSVSIPAPVYYADLVCSRLMFHLNPSAAVAHSDDGQSTASGANAAFDMSVWRTAYTQTNKDMAKTMYFL